jgi:hypothetical protein
MKNLIMNPAGIVLAACILVVAAAGTVVSTQTACSPAADANAAKAVVGGLTTACTQLETQPEPAWVTFACNVVDEAGTVINTFAVKKPAAEAPAFAAKYAPAKK